MKITFKEFKEIITEVEGAIDYGNILNMLCRLYNNDANQCNINGFYKASDRLTEKANTVYEFLDSKRFYD